MAIQGKIIKSIAGFYEVYTGEGEKTIYRCRAKGVFRALGEKPLVGDDCLIEVTDTVSSPPEGNVVKLLPRRNDLIRPNVANVDQALLLFAITHPVPSLALVDRFLIILQQKNLPAILCFNKQDLATGEEIEELRKVYEACGCRVLFLSARDEEGDLAPVRDEIRGKTTVITGPSGAGKSTLINALCPGARMETGELSRKIARGKNTTRHVELLPAQEENTFLVDTPGFTSLYLFDTRAEDLKAYYPEFAPYAGSCRYHGCNHVSEPGCGVRRAYQDGKIPRIRYENYLALFAELRDQKPVYGKKK
jgi:ribosome biogenesis GTPase